MSEETESGETSPADGEGSPAELETPKAVLSEIQITLGEHSKFIADNFDKLYEEVQQLKDSLAATEIRLRTEMDEKLKAMQEMLLARIELLEGRTAEQSTKIEEQQHLSKQQNAQLEDLQRQVGVLFFRLH